MSTFTTHSQTMHYLDKGEGPVLVFGHSFLWDSQMWAPQIEVLSQHYRCIVPDFWSHGQSDATPTTTNNLTDYANDILALMDYLNVEQFSIIGLSVGGMWATELTVLAPQRVKSLVLMDTFVGLEPEIMHSKYFAMLDILEQQQHAPESLIQQIIPMFFSKNVTQDNPQLITQCRQNLEMINGEQAKDIAKIGRMVFGRRDAFDDLEKFALPALIMVGMQDYPRPPLESQLMHDALSGSELLVIPDAGHIANLEQPQRVTEKLVSFLNQVYS